MFNNSNSNPPILAGLLKLAESLPRRRDDSLFMHPDVLTEFMKGILAENLAGIFGGISPLLGVPVYSSPFMPKHPKKWQFPRDPFVDYEESDEAWARPVNYGKEVDDTTKLVGYAIRMPRY